jgi:putative polymerase
MQVISAHAIPAASRMGPRLVFAAVTFNMILCLISTRGSIHMSSAVVILFEMIILMTGLYAMRARITEQAVRIMAVTAAFLIGMKFINAGLDLKILHDIGIIYIFYELGTLATARTGNRVLWTVMLIVLAVSSFEVTMPAQFGEMFNVWSYYVDKGVIAASTVNYSNTTSFISGARGGEESRTYLASILGSARFSSVFLEPVSMGNFSVIAFAWCVSTRVGAWRGRALLIACAATCFVLGDSRFASACWLLMLAIRMTPLYRSRLFVFCMPVVVMLALLINGSVHALPGVTPAIQDDNFPGRLLFSGRLLDYWGLPQWFGLAPSPVYTSDTGYAYVINNLGLPLALFLWAVFAFHKPRTAEGMSMKAMVAVYAATSLCIGANMFTIKTAALCWFLYGAANALESVRPATVPALFRRPEELGGLSRSA